MGESIVMISDGGGLREAMPACLYGYRECGRTYARAMAAGAQSIEPRGHALRRQTRHGPDSWSNIWQIATYRAR